MTATTWYDEARVSKPGSVVLNRWLDSRSGARERAGFAPRNDISGSMSIQSFASWFDQQTQGGGIATTSAAMRVSTVYACISLLGGATSSLPLDMFRRDADGDRERIRPDEWWMFNEQPTPAWAATTAWEYAMASLLLQGDSFWRILRASRLSPKIVGFEPLHPGTVIVRRVDDRLVYDVGPQPWMLNSPRVPPVVVTLDQDDVLHAAGPGYNGLRGMSQITGALQVSGGISLMADRYAQSFFKNSARPDFVLTTDTPQKFQKEQIDQLRAQFEDIHRGVDNGWKPAILNGLKVQPITMTAQDAQILETRKFGVEEICRLMGVPPFMVGHTEKTSSWGTGVEQMGIGFVKYTLQRHLVKFEQEINRKVFRTAARFCEFNVAGLERADITSRFNAYRVALGRAGEQPWMDANEVRRLENMLPRDDLKPNATAAAPATEGNA